ncbi:MAG: hypothetical protein IKT14_05165 [Clostridiales bacterium]|nr:hypothetical protein [Clostridiales bacterium]
MSKYPVMIPQHFPGGENLSAESLKTLNKKRKALLPKIIFSGIGILITAIVLTVIFSVVIGGGVGNILTAVTWIVFPIAVASEIGAMASGLKREYTKLGITQDQFGEAVRNFKSDTPAWGEKAEKQVSYRFNCRKCKKDSGWRSYTISSCDQDTLKTRCDEFMRQTGKKKNWFFKKNFYTLDRKCPQCGKLQPKHAPRWWTIIIFAAAGFVIPALIRVIIISASPSLNDYLNKNATVDGMITFGFWLAVIIFGVVRFVRGRSKKTSPEYTFETKEE